MGDSALKSLPPPQLSDRVNLTQGGRSSASRLRWLVACVLGLAWFLCSSSRTWNFSHFKIDPFYANITGQTNICASPYGPVVSHSGYIGLRGDTESTPKRSFFWYFEAEHDAVNAPIILTIGGGPGTTEHFNLIALDHPVGVGASYGAKVNNSRDAAIDVYDFLQKFFVVFPHLAQNRFILSGGSYGGMYVPHIATVIHEHNTALAAGKGLAGAIHINLESMMVSNPISDATSHYTWLLQTRCYNHDVYNASTCAEMFKLLPTCLDSIRLAQETPGWLVERRAAAHNICIPLQGGDTHGTTLDDVRVKASILATVPDAN
ncbi:SET domain-containing protein [Mycena venus]|uniref:SET domain-containing protein n=1 Tax=Mycena venus TaxID=2733690 RepID=A0A8H6XFE8_9AGAR|nr:SET domain-containing protein [Mycena venus]